MSNGDNRMSTQDDPKNMPWQNSELQAIGILHPPKPNSPIQFYSESMTPSAWLSGATVGSAGTSATLLAEGSLTAHLIRRNTSITPATGSMTIGPPHVEVIKDGADSPEGNHEDSPIPAAAEESVTNSNSRIPAHQNADWVKRLSWGISKHLREQIFGDLCEIREKMAAEGYSRSQIKWTTLCYLLSSILYGLSLIFFWLWNRFGWIMAIFK